MRVEIVYESSPSELIDKIKNVPLLHDENIKPYKNSKVVIKSFNINELRPATFYLLRDNINIQRYLREILLKEFNIDTFKLDRWYILKVRNKENYERSIIPIIVQLSPFSGESFIIEDGNHRAWIARESEEEINAVYIENVPKEIPYYAYPNPKGWDDVKIFNDISEVKLKKKYRIEDKNERYKLYRNYDAIFPGLGKPR
jgi:hypothetical protein